MIGRIRGYLVWDDEVNEVLIEENNGSVSWEITVPKSDLNFIREAEHEVTIYTRQVFRDDGHKLYGFLTMKGKRLFDGLISIKGVGPSMAIKILGWWPHPETFLQVLFDDEINQKVMEGIPGIGKKTAAKIIAEGKTVFASDAPDVNIAGVRL